MKRIRIGNAIGSLGLALALPLALGCEINLPVDNPDENPGILRPLGIIRGTASYVGPPPCFKNGEVEGALIVLMFDAGNPPPPDGLASTALNFSTVPGTRMFANFAAPTTGPGSTKSPKESYCPSITSPTVTAAAEWSLQQVPAGRYQIRAFYSRQNRFNPLFNYANLALAGDVPGGSFENPAAVPLKYATVEVGVPIVAPATCKTDDRACNDRKEAAAKGLLEIPPQGFLREGVPVVLGNPLRSNRPFFHIDYERSLSYAPAEGIDPNPDLAPGTPVLQDFCGAASCPRGSVGWDQQRRALTPEQSKKLGYVTFPQDHLSTSRSFTDCLGEKDPTCDAFKFAQASFPQLRFKFGFPGDANNPAMPTDAWLMKNAKARDPFDAAKARPFYGVDPKEFAADIPTSNGFFLTRNFNAAGVPEILRDNKSLEDLAEIAEIFPTVVLSKMVDDGEGNIALPPRSQTDPIVVIQTITLRDWKERDLQDYPAAAGLLGTPSMKATSQGPAIGGGLTTADGKAADPTEPLYTRTGFEVQDGFTALVRPSVVCIYPQTELRGYLNTPVRLDPNPENRGSPLVDQGNILKYRANRVKGVTFGCLPPGAYSVNVVYPTGQAWSFPNLSGHCSFSARLQPNEECMNTSDDLRSGFFWNDNKRAITPFDFTKGFPMRPLVRSQMLYQTEANGMLKMLTDANGKSYPAPQVVIIKPSPRCGKYMAENDPSNACSTDASCDDRGAAFSGVCIAGPGGKGKFCDFNGDAKISTAKIWFNNPVNEDTVLTTDVAANGLLDADEDKNGNGKLDLKVPNVCSLPFKAWAGIEKINPDKLLK